MTEQELQSVINAVLSSIKTNSRSIGQLTGVQTLSDSDCFEVAGGRKIAYSVLRDLIFAAANTKLENMQTDIANSVLQSVSFDVTGSTATLTIKQKGYDAITVSVPIATDSQSGIMTAADKVKLDSTYSKQEIKQEIDAEADAIRDEMMPRINNLATVVNEQVSALNTAIGKKADKAALDAAYGEINIDNIDSLCTADDMLQGKPACYTVLYTLVSTKGTVTVKVGVLWVYSDNLRHVVMQVLNTNFVPDDDGTFSSHTHNHDMHEYSRIYCYDSNAASHAGVAVKTWTQWQEVGGKGIVDLITNVALAKQNKLTAGDDATRLNGAKLSTKQIFTGSIDTTAGAVPMLLPAGGCIYNSADKKLYIGDSNSQPVEVAKPNDFLFFSNGKLYHYQFGNFGEVETGTTLVAGDKATRINASALSTKQIYRGTVINTNTVPTLPVGAYCFNTATKELYVGAQHDNAVVTDTVPMPDDFLFIDTKSGTTYRCDGTTLNNIANIKTINGQSLLGKGNVWLTGEDFLLEQDAGLTINEAVNSNTDALQNKLGKDSIVQTTGTATDKVMSQKAVTDDINSAISLARRQGVPQAKCFQFSKNYTFYSGSQLKDKTLIVGLYGAGDFLKGGSIYYNNSVHELQIGNGEKKRLTGRVNYSDHAETLVVYFDDDGIAHAYMDGKLCYDFPSNTQPDTVTINVLEGRKFKQILLLDGDLHQAANDLLWAKGWQDWLINNRNMNTTREVKKIDNSTDRWMAPGTTLYKLYVVDYNITNNTEKEAKVSVNTGSIGYGGDIVIPAGQSVSVRRLIDTSAQGALGYNSNNLPFSLTAKSVAVIKGIDYRYVYNGGYYDLAGLVPTDEPTIIPNPEEYLKLKSNKTYPDAVGQIGYDTTGRLYMGAIDLTWKQINNT